MTDTTHKAPERVYMLPSFAAGLEKKPQYGSTAEYILKSHSDDLVQAAVAAALREAVSAVKQSADDDDISPGAAQGVIDDILALITEDAQAALDRVVAAGVKPYRIALADATRRPMGVVPASAEGLVTTVELDAAEQLSWMVQRRFPPSAKGESDA